MTTTKPNNNNSANSKKITVTLGDGAQTEIAISGIRFIQIVNGPKAGEEGGAGAGFQAKIFEAGKVEPSYARESVSELRSNDLQLVYVGGGKYAVRGNIARLEPLGAEERKTFSDQKGAETAKFKTRVVLTGELGSFWAVKGIDELNERGVRFVNLGDGSAVHMMNVRKLAELTDDDRGRISGKYNIDASGFRSQVVVQGEDRPKLARLSLVELREQGLDLVDIGEHEFVVRSNVKFFGPFTEEDQERLGKMREGIKADRFATKLTMANGNGAVLSVRTVDQLKGEMQAVNIGYDRYVPAANIVQDRVSAFTKDEKSSLSDAGYDVQRAWKSSVALVNGMALSPATPDQVRDRCVKALGAAPAAKEPEPESVLG